MPDDKAWRKFIDHLLLWLGSLALAFSALFFIAYNWNDIGRFAKLGMMEALIVFSIIAYLKIGGQSIAGKISLLIASIFLGVLLALFGQTYQTGADPWQLFLTWALLMLPWAIISRFPVIWILWILLINLSIVLYHQTFQGGLLSMFGSGVDTLWLVFIFNTLALITWEFLTNKWSWLSERWAVRTLAVSCGIPINWIILSTIFDHINGNIISVLVWAVWLAVLYYVYRNLKHDLFMLAGICLSGIVVSVAFVSNIVLESSAGASLLIAMLVIGLGTGSAIWLRNIHREWES